MPSHLELKFGDGDYTFALKLPQILEIQRLCGAGIFTIYGRVLKGRYTLQNSDVSFGVPHECEAYILDVYETVRLALIGGNAGVVNGQPVTVNANRALELVQTYLHPPVPLREAWDYAAAILSALIEGYDDPAQKKSPVEASKPSTKRKRSQTAR